MLSAEKIREKLTQDDIIKLCFHLQGSEEIAWDSYGNPIFNTVLDHPDGDSMKEYYSHEMKIFTCFTSASSYDVFEMVRRAKQFDSFKEAFDYVVQFFGIKDKGFDEATPTEMIDDWDVFQRVKDYNKTSVAKGPENKIIQENLLEYFYPIAAPTEWLQEGISAPIMRYFGIRVDSALDKIIIPHRDVEGNLIGIRGRSYNPFEVDAGKKYMPVFIERDMYNHPLGKNLFGLWCNKETIKRIKKVFVAESEKSVMQLATMYGIENCWAVATCGSSISKDQMNLLLELGVEELVLGYDADFVGGKGSPDAVEYEQKLLKIVAPLLPYVNVSVIMDYDHLGAYKSSPTDSGKEVFEKLYHSRIKLYTYAESLKKRRGN